MKIFNRIIHYSWMSMKMIEKYRINYYADLASYSNMHDENMQSIIKYTIQFNTEWYVKLM